MTNMEMESKWTKDELTELKSIERIKAKGETHVFTKMG